MVPTFEVCKAYIWQQRTLCETCWQQRLALTGELRQLQSRWRARRASVKNDITTLRRWRELLQQLPGYGGRQDVAQIAMLERLLGAEHRRKT